MLKFDRNLQPALKHLHQYQVLFFCNNHFGRHFKEGDASGYEIICRDGNIRVHKTCVYFSDFLFDQHQARKNYNDKNNRKFQLKQFHKESLKIVFDALYGISQARDYTIEWLIYKR